MLRSAISSNSTPWQIQQAGPSRECDQGYSLDTNDQRYFRPLHLHIFHTGILFLSSMKSLCEVLMIFLWRSDTTLSWRDDGVLMTFFIEF